MKHRDYQQAAIGATFKAWEEHRSTMVVMPTGAGKSHVIAGIAERMRPKRTIVIAHRHELIFQTADKIREVAGLDCEIEKAELVASTNLFSRSPVIVASVQTLISPNGENSRRMCRFDPKEFGCIIVDENHHSPAKSYREIIRYFMDGNPDLKLFGCTATPDRNDEEALGQAYESVAFDYEILDAINDGWLTPVEQRMVTIDKLDYSGVRTTAGDLNLGDLSAVMESEYNMQGVAAAALQIIGFRRSLVFTASVKQAETLCNIFNRHRSGFAEFICGATPPDKRREILRRLKDGTVQVVCNCAVLTEGFDNPAVEVVVMARATKSRALYSQMAGRCMRPLPGLVDRFDLAEDRRLAIASSAKPKCEIVDFVGNSGRHKLVTTADILGGNVSDEAIERATARARKAGGPVKMVELLEEEAEKLAKEQEQRRQEAEARRRRLTAQVKFSATLINPFDALQLIPARDRGWDNGRILSEKQRALLARNGMDPDNFTFAQGSQVIREIFRRWNGRLATVKQCNVIKKYRPSVDIRNINMQDASKVIDEIKASGWRRLQPQPMSPASAMPG